MIKILIPTAKEMKVCQNIAWPKLSAQTKIIIDYFSTLTVSDLEDIYRINTSAARCEAQRWQDFKAKQLTLNPAIKLFNGLCTAISKGTTYPQVKHNLWKILFLLLVLFMASFLL